MKPAVLVCVLLELIAFPLLLIWVLKTNSPVAVTLLIIVCIPGAFGIAALCMTMMWNPIMRAWPPRQPGPEAVRRNFQSFSLGLLNLGLSIHVAADDEYLHLQPARLIRWMGAVSTSIPWNAMEPMAGRKATAVKLGPHTMIGPRWCMELVSPRTD